MKRAGRSTRVLALLCALVPLALGQAAQAAGGISLTVPDPVSAGSGVEPLTDVNSWFAFPDETKTATVDISSTAGFSGWALVTVTCCIDAATGQAVHPAATDLRVGPAANGSVWTFPHQLPHPPKVWCRFPFNPKGCTVPPALTGEVYVHLNSGESTGFPIYLRTGSAPTPGRYKVTVSARSLIPDTSIRTPNSFLNLAILPAVAADAPLPANNCPPTAGKVVGLPPFAISFTPMLETLPLMSVTKSLYMLKETDLHQTTFSIGAQTAGGPGAGLAWAGWVITVSPPPAPLPPNTTVITLKNSTKGWDKEIAAFDSKACPQMVTPHNTFRAAPGQSVTITVDSTMATSVLLRRQACAGWDPLQVVCLDGDFWEDIAIFNESNFYSLVGGRMVTIDWFFSQAE